MVNGQDSRELDDALRALDDGDFAAAARLLIPLAQARNPRAQCNLAALYHLGLGVPTDGKRAVELYWDVAKQEILDRCLSGVAYNNLATIYFAGLPDVEPDSAKARQCRLRAKELGFEL